MIRSKSQAAYMLLMALSIISASILPAAAENEPNDSFATAEWVTPGTQYTGNTNLTDMDDYYKFNLSEGQSCSIGFMVGMTSCPFSFYFYDPDESLLKSSGPVESYCSWYAGYTLGHSGAGSYYLAARAEVCATYPYGSYGLQLAVGNQSDAGKPGDAGDNASTARDIVEGSYEGWVADRDEVDHYKVYVPVGHRLNASLRAGTAGNSSLKMALYRSSGILVNGTGPLPPGALVTLRHTTSGLAPDSYTLSVCQTAGSGNNYTLSLSVRPQNDAGSGKDAPADPLRGLVLPRGGTYGGWLADDDTADAYNLTLSGGQLLDCTLRAGLFGAQSVELTLIRPDGDSIFSISATPGGSCNRSWILNSAGGGTYHLLVKNSNSYDLTLAVGDQEDAGAPGDAGDTVDIARPIFQNRNYAGMLGGDDAADTYSFTGRALQMLMVNISISNASGQGHMLLYGPSSEVLVDVPGVTAGIPISKRAALPRDGRYLLAVLGGRMDYAFELGLPPDSALPQLNITSPGEKGGFATPEVTFTGTASDDVGVALVQISLDNSTWLNCTGTTEWRANLSLLEGANLVYVRVKDMAGNTVRETRLVFYDRIPPVLNVTCPADGAYLNVHWTEVRGSASDNCLVTAVDVSTDGTSWVRANGTTTWSVANLSLAEGANTLFVRVVDPAGNNDTRKLHVITDTRPPMVAVANPANGSCLRNVTVDLSGMASDGVSLAKVEVSLSGGPWRTVPFIVGESWSFPDFTFGWGTCSLTARATDAAGNTARATVMVTVDANAPAVAIAIPSEGKKVSGARLTVRGTASDDLGLANVTLSVNGETFPVEGTSSWGANVTLKEGKNMVVATATDAAGNVQSATITVTYEKPKPQPGFEALGLAAALALAVSVLGGIKRKGLH